MLETDVVRVLRAAGCVFAEDEAALLIEAGGDLHDLVARRVAGLPLEHLLGWVEFGGLRIPVDPGVFVPRQRTLLLAEEAVRLARSGDTVVDLCSGCGAIGLVIADRVPGIELRAVERDEVAAANARRNVEAAGGHAYEGSLFEPLSTGLRNAVDIVTCNAPYVPTEEIGLMPPEARDHEPAIALDGGADGLDVLRAVATEAPDWLRPGGHLLVEVSEQQAPVLAAHFEGAGLTARIVADGETGGTVLVGTT